MQEQSIMLVHSVFFWLKKDLSAEQVERFHAGVRSLEGIASTEAVYVGTPASTDRPVIDRSYDVGLTVLLRGMAEHDAYQADPLHQQFLADFADHWERVLIYDAI